MAWLGFWIFMSVFMACDTWLFFHGYDSFFWKAKTPAEIELHNKAGQGSPTKPEGVTK